MHRFIITAKRFGWTAVCQDIRGIYLWKRNWSWLVYLRMGGNHQLCERHPCYLPSSPLSLSLFSSVLSASSLASVNTTEGPTNSPNFPSASFGRAASNQWSSTPLRDIGSRYQPDSSYNVDTALPLDKVSNQTRSSEIGWAQRSSELEKPSEIWVNRRRVTDTVDLAAGRSLDFLKMMNCSIPKRLHDFLRVIEMQGVTSWSHNGVRTMRCRPKVDVSKETSESMVLVMKYPPLCANKQWKMRGKDSGKLKRSDAAGEEDTASEPSLLLQWRIKLRMIVSCRAR